MRWPEFQVCVTGALRNTSGCHIRRQRSAAMSGQLAPVQNPSDVGILTHSESGSQKISNARDVPAGPPAAPRMAAVGGALCVRWHGMQELELYFSLGCLLLQPLP